MKQREKTAAILLVIVLAFFYAHIAKNEMIYDKQIDSSEYRVLDTDGDSIEQKFVCRVETLDAVRIKCQFSGNVENSKIRMTLAECETNTTVAVSELAGTEIKSGKFNSFSFEKVENCYGKSYRAILENIGSSNEENNGVGFYAQPGTENNTRLTVGGVEEDATLIMKTVTNCFDIETFVVLLIMILYICVFFRFLCKLFSR